ncbi:thioesterase II family protein [Streptomyces leeuwenhoekii]|uniref:thioesterase II family protein n=1 Tax=Streptomyces leeuwenhoekii TaxID=1437453 RepID=UPI0036A30E5F
MTSTATVIDSPWIRRFHPAPDRPVRMVCLPHAGGSASYYFPLSQALSAHADVLTVQYPGRQDRRTEPFIDSIPETADRIFEVLRPLTDRPLVLFGHSMGASVGFEVALRLEADTEAVDPAMLFASGRRAPGRDRQETVHLRDDAGIIEELRSLSGTEQSLLDDEETLRLILPALRNDYRAAETYRPVPGRRLRCPVTALVGDNDPKATVDEAAAWAEHTAGAFRLRVFPGDHFYLGDRMAEVARETASHLTHLS